MLSILRVFGPLMQNRLHPMALLFSGNTVVEHSAHKLKIKGLNPPQLENLTS
jgi:hypothetical protein